MPPRRRAGRTSPTYLNPASLEVLQGCKVEPMLGDVTPGSRYQFERLGYFSVDADSTPGRARVQSHRVAQGFLGEDRRARVGSRALGSSTSALRAPADCRVAASRLQVRARFAALQVAGRSAGRCAPSGSQRPALDQEYERAPNGVSTCSASAASANPQPRSGEPAAASAASREPTVGEPDEPAARAQRARTYTSPRICRRWCFRCTT